MGRGRTAGAWLVAAALVVATGAAPSGAYPRPGETIRVNRHPGEQVMHGQFGDQGDLHDTAVSSDGRYVVFASTDPALAAAVGYPGSTLSVSGSAIVPQVFRYDVERGRLEMASLSSVRVPALGGAQSPRLSDSGRIVVFESEAPNLVVDDGNTAMDVFARDMVTGVTERVSVASSGAESTPTGAELIGRNEANPSLSGNGRYVAFSSYASDLVARDTNGTRDVFVHDRVTHTTRRASITSTGKEANGYSGGGSLSASGRFVVFTTSAPNMTADGKPGVVRRDMETGKITLVSLAADGTHPDPATGGSSVWPQRAVSGDGRFVVFDSTAPGMVPNKGTPTTWGDIFIRDIRARRTLRVNVSSHGEEAFGGSSGAAISANGRYVAFSSNADNLTDGDASAICATCVGLYQVAGQTGDRDLFIHDVVTGSTERMTLKADGQEATSCGASMFGGVSATAGLSPSGRFVTFRSCYDGMVAGDSDNGESWDAYRRDRGTALGAQSPSADAVTPLCMVEGPCIPVDGAIQRRDRITEVGSPAADLYGVAIAYRPRHGDLFVRVQLDSLPAIAGVSLGAQLLYGLELTVGGARYQLRAQRVAGPDFLPTGGASFGLFAHDEASGLFRRSSAVRGGFGTRGPEVVFSLPLSLLGGKAAISDVRAFTAVGAYATGPTLLLDTVAVD